MWLITIFSFSIANNPFLIFILKSCNEEKLFIEIFMPSNAFSFETSPFIKKLLKHCLALNEK